MPTLVHHQMPRLTSKAMTVYEVYHVGWGCEHRYLLFQLNFMLPLSQGQQRNAYPKWKGFSWTALGCYIIRLHKGSPPHSIYYRMFFATLCGILFMNALEKVLQVLNHD